MGAITRKGRHKLQVASFSALAFAGTSFFAAVFSAVAFFERAEAAPYDSNVTAVQWWAREAAAGKIKARVASAKPGSLRCALRGPRG
jgi:hypothetical protein